MTLPTERSKIEEHLLDYTILIHGAPKIGKSTLADQAGDVFFADTEGGLKALSVFKKPTIYWNEPNDEERSFLHICAQFIEGNHNYTAMCIDTIDTLHQICVAYITKKYEIIHPSDLEWGKGWQLVKDELMRPLAKLAVSEYGLIFTSHTRDKEIVTRTAKITKAVPTLQDYVWNQIAAFVDIILYYDTESTTDGEKRYIRTKPSEKWIAGDRTKRLLIHDPIEVSNNPDTNSWKLLERAFGDKREKSEIRQIPKEEIKKALLGG